MTEKTRSTPEEPETETSKRLVFDLGKAPKDMTDEEIKVASKKFGAKIREMYPEKFAENGPRS